MLQRLDRADAAARDRGDVAERQVGDEAQQHDGALVIGQTIERILQVGIGDRWLILDGGPLRDWPVDDLGPSGAMAPDIHETMVGDREYPPSSPLGVAPDAMCVAGDMEEDFAEHVLGVGSAL